MNHQPFKEWLLSEEPLSTEQSQALQDHMQTCETCRQLETSWTGVHNFFKLVPEVSPAAGFTNRWHTRLAAQQRKVQRRRAWMVLAATALVALVLLIILGYQAWSVLQSPAQLMFLWISQITSWYSLFFSIQHYSSLIFEVMPILPIIGTILTIGVFCFLIVLWVAAYKQLVLARRVVQ